MNYLIFSAFLPQFLCQFVADVGMKPDVTFGEHNDRFDLTPMFQRQNKFYDRHTYKDEGDDEYRRTGKIVRNGVVEDFGFRYPSAENPNDGDYKTNLMNFLAENSRKSFKLVERLHESNKMSRRSLEADTKEHTVPPPDPEKEVLMHHAVPINMTIEGFLMAPLDE